MMLNRLKEDYPDAGGYPWVIIDGEVVGPLTETAKLFLTENGLVMSQGLLKNERNLTKLK